MPLSLTDRFLSKASPGEYVSSVGFDPYEWQMREILSGSWNRLLLNSCRQAGKSVSTAGLGWHTAKSTPNGLVLMFAPSERQSLELDVKLMDFASKDSELGYISGSRAEKRLKNGCRLLALPGTERSIRGFSDPTLIIIDEASRTDDALYRSVRPMMVGGNCRLIAMSTPFGRRGWFYEEWANNPIFHKVLVKAPVDIVDGKVVPVKESEKAFKKRMLKDGIQGYYSPRHDMDFMTEEWESMPEWWFRQEYLGEFMEAESSAFSARDIDLAFSSDEEFTVLDEEVLDEKVNVVSGLWD